MSYPHLLESGADPAGALNSSLHSRFQPPGSAGCVCVGAGVGDALVGIGVGVAEVGEGDGVGDAVVGLGVGDPEVGDGTGLALVNSNQLRLTNGLPSPEANVKVILCVPVRVSVSGTLTVL